METPAEGASLSAASSVEERRLARTKNDDIGQRQQQCGRAARSTCPNIVSIRYSFSGSGEKGGVYRQSAHLSVRQARGLQLPLSRFCVFFREVGTRTPLYFDMETSKKPWCRRGEECISAADDAAACTCDT